MSAETTHTVPGRARQPLNQIFGELGWANRRQQRAAHDLLGYVFATLRSPGEFDAVPREALGGGVERAVAEGASFKRDVLGRIDMLTPDAAARKAGITRQGLDLRRRQGKALALAYAKRGFRYPAWQFEDSLAEPLLEILPQLAPRDGWACYLLLTDPEPLLGGQSVIEALRAGSPRVRRVIELLATPETP